MAEQAGMVMFKVKTPRFCKIILEDTARIGKLRVPNAFAAEHGAELPNTAVLNLPNGSEWKVRVLRSGRKIWFHTGWREFAQFNSLAHGHFLVFQYDSCGHFLVLIFDMSCTEIDYKTKEVARAVKQECVIVDESDVPLNDQIPSPKTREKPPLRSPKPHKLRRTENEKGKFVRNSETNDHTIDNQAKNQMFGSRKLLINAEKASVVSRANACFKSENPFFLLAMQPSYVCSKWRVNLPVQFIMTHLKRKRGNIVLQVSDGRVWSVEYIIADSSRQLRAYFNYKGWTPFARGNSLNVGDVCAFELVKGGTEPILNVVIFRATQDLPNHCSSPLGVANRPNAVKPKKSLISPQLMIRRSEKKPRFVSNSETLANKQVIRKMTGDHSLGESLKDKLAQKLTLTPAERTRALARATAAFKTENPSFLLAMQPSYVGTKLKASPLLPLNFVVRNLEWKRGDFVLQVPDGRLWTVEYSVVDNGGQVRASFGFKSWTRFSRENSLKVGDVCAFELVKSGVEPKFNVFIFRATDDLPIRANTVKPKKSSSSPGRIDHGSTRTITGYSPGSTSGNASKRSKQSNSSVQLLSFESLDRPFFRVPVAAYHLSTGQMPIPKAFGSHVKEFYDEAELWVADKCWSVKIRKYVKKTGKQLKFLGVGWGAFAAVNSLEVGDVCVYEVMNGEADDDDSRRTTMVLSVRIFRGFLKLFFSPRREEIEELAGMSMFKSEIPRFMVVILDDPVRTGKLMVPKEYAEEYGDELHDTVVLKLPNELQWEVGVIRRRGKIWFQSGWREFARFNSLAQGHFLFFQYDRSGGHFLVFIFDMTATEVDYNTEEPPRVVKLEPESGAADASDVPTSDQFISPKARGKPPLSSSQPRKLRRRNEKANFGINSETVVCRGSSSKQRRRDMTSDQPIDNQAKNNMSGSRKLTSAGKARVVARARAGFKSENPFFLLHMQASYVSNKKNNLPRKFFRRYFKEKQGFVGLRVLDGSVCNVEYRVRIIGSQERAFFTSKSWIPFVRKNSLEVGDVCAFELVKGGAEPMLDVVIFRATAEDLVTRYPSGASEIFNVFSLHDRLPCSIQTLPFHFCKTYLTENHGKVVLQVPDGRAWTVKYRLFQVGSGGKPVFKSKYWAQFARDNSLKVGDVCAFELLQGGTEPIFNVVIFPNPTDAAKPKNDSTPSDAGTEYGKVSKQPVESSNPSEAGTASTSKQPSFEVSVEASHLTKGQMAIPNEFRDHVKELYGEAEAAELQIAKKSWRVGIRRLLKGSRCSNLGDGWGVFARDNSLEVGDVCVYELKGVEEDDDVGGRSGIKIVLGVQISRS
ncbi:B3 domain-containing transcription factor VRN1 [Linum grandiflorum]